MVRALPAKDATHRVTSVPSGHVDVTVQSELLLDLAAQDGVAAASSSATTARGI